MQPAADNHTLISSCPYTKTKRLHEMKTIKKKYQVYNLSVGYTITMSYWRYVAIDFDNGPFRDPKGRSYPHPKY